MQIKLIAFDLDGTTLNSKKEISERNRLALRKAFKQGIKLIPCTGRSMYEFPNELNKFIDEFGFEIFPFVITENGAQVYDLSKKKLLYSKSIPKETAKAILLEGRKQLAVTYGSFGIMGACDNTGVAWESNEIKPYLDDFLEKWNPSLANLEELIEWNDGLTKFSMTFLNEDGYNKFFSYFSTWPGLALSSSWENSIEIMTKGISKGEALTFVSRHIGIPLDHVMAIGDNLNDLEMIQCVKFGVAMENAIPVLKDNADWITASNDNDGFALAIEKVLSK